MDTVSPQSQDDKTTLIYALIDPNTKQIRYIGKTDNLQRRMRYHMWEHYPTHKCRWIQSLKTSGQCPETLILEEVPVSLWQERERYWIAYGREQGWPLTNGTDGGEGNQGMPMTEEWKRKIGEKAKGRPGTKGRKPTPEQIAAWRVSMGDKIIENAKKASMAAALARKGRPPRKGYSRTCSESTRDKISTSLKGRPRSPESIAKMIATMKSKNHSIDAGQGA